MHLSGVRSTFQVNGGDAIFHAVHDGIGDWGFKKISEQVGSSFLGGGGIEEHRDRQKKGMDLDAVRSQMKC